MVSLLNAVNSEFTDKTGYILPTEIAEKVARECEQEYWATIYTHDCTSLDTADRDIAFDCIATELGFEAGWPLYMSTQEYTESFWAAIEKLEKA